MTSVAEKLAKKSTRRTASKQVRLRLVHVDFWPIVKLVALIGFCGVIVTLVAVALLWTVLVQTGVFDSVNSLLNDITGGEDGEGVTVASFIDFSSLMLYSIVVAVLNWIAVTALAAIAAFLYNLSVRITGGLVFGFTNN